MKIAAKVVAREHYTVFHIAEVAVPCDLLRRAVELISELRSLQTVRC